MARNIKPCQGKKNEWLLTIEAGRHPGTGERQRIRKTFIGGIRAAEAEYDRIKSEIKKGVNIYSDKLSTGQYFTNWLSDYGSLRLSPTTIRRYRQIIVGRIIPKIGAIPLAKLCPMDLQKFYREIIEEGQMVRPTKKDKEKNTDPVFKPLSYATIIYHHRVIHKALDTALKQQMILTNPADAVEIPRPPSEMNDDGECDAAEQVKVLTSEQVDTMLSTAAGVSGNKVKPGSKKTKTRIKNTDYYPLLHTAIKTGLRRGELLGLKWADVSFTDKTLSISRSLAYVPEKGIFFKVPKTKGSRRKIDLSDEVVKVLKAHKKDQAEARIFWGEKYSNEKLIFCQDDGQPMHPDTLSKWFPEYLEQIGLPRLNFHCLRHTHASLMLAAGINMFRVSRRLGHSSIRITMDVYGHLMPGDGASDVEKFEAIFKNGH